VDDFLSNLWKIHMDVKAEGYAHEWSLGMFRSDYMLDAATDSVKQVEFNTISSSFGGLSELVTKMHQELATFPSPSSPLAYPRHPLFTLDGKPNTPPDNNAVETLVEGLAQAHYAYGSGKTADKLPVCVIFLVQPNERNIFDQLALSQRLSQKYGIPSFRLPTTAVLEQTSVSATATRPLLYRPPSSPDTIFEVSTVYFRALYAPSEYTSPDIWKARHHLERSAATKCPSVLLHLSGSKKIQQILTSTDPDHLVSFLPESSADRLATLRATFAPQYALDGEGLSIALDAAKARNYVLKPQREGGGNNIYRDHIPTFLNSIPASEYKQYVLMELIHPPKAAHNTVLRSDGEVVSGDVISELGIFGTCLWRNSSPEIQGATSSQVVRPDIIHNKQGGYLLRTKASGSDEGGVAAGFSSLDSVLLYDDEHLR
jgi:glutathione synthase